MMQRYQINDQPTLIRENPILNNQFKRNRIATTSCTNINLASSLAGNSQNFANSKSKAKEDKTKRVSPMPVNTYGKPEIKNKSIYENLYTIE